MMNITKEELQAKWPGIEIKEDFSRQDQFAVGLIVFIPGKVIDTMDELRELASKVSYYYNYFSGYYDGVAEEVEGGYRYMVMGWKD